MSSFYFLIFVVSFISPLLPFFSWPYCFLFFSFSSGSLAYLSSILFLVLSLLAFTSYKGATLKMSGAFHFSLWMYIPYIFLFLFGIKGNCIHFCRKAFYHLIDLSCSRHMMQQSITASVTCQAVVMKMTQGL